MLERGGLSFPLSTGRPRVELKCTQADTMLASTHILRCEVLTRLIVCNTDAALHAGRGMASLLAVATNIHTHLDGLDARKQLPDLLHTLISLVDQGPGVTAYYGVRALYYLTDKARYYAKPHSFGSYPTGGQAETQVMYMSAVKAAQELAATIMKAGALEPLARCTRRSGPPLWPTPLAPMARAVMANLNYWSLLPGGIAVPVS